MKLVWCTDTEARKRDALECTSAKEIQAYMWQPRGNKGRGDKKNIQCLIANFYNEDIIINKHGRRKVDIEMEEKKEVYRIKKDCELST